jgi:hypothetical protein
MSYTYHLADRQRQYRGGRGAIVPVLLLVLLLVGLVWLV